MAQTGADSLTRISSLRSWLSKLSPFGSPFERVPEAEKLFNLCKETIQKSTEQWSTAKGVNEDFRINKCQCDLLVEKLSGVQGILEKIHQSKLHDGSKTILPLQELRHTLLDADALLNASCMTNSNWPRAAIELGDMEKTFSKLLYDMKWCTDILVSTLMDNSGRDSKFGQEDCEWKLSKEDDLNLLMAILEDEESLRDHLSSAKLDDDPKEIKQGLADQLLKQMEELSRSDLLFMKPEGLDMERSEFLGQGGYGTVQTTNFLGSLCAMKIIMPRHEEVQLSFLKELEVIKELGHHPNLVRLLCYSQKDSDKYYLIMEKMQVDLLKAVGLNDVRDSTINAVSLMLQIGEGVKYIHSKGVAHRDLKPENVLVNLENWPSNKSLPRRISAVKIADFGVSKTKEASKTYSNQSTTGTTLYMAPEVLKVGDDDPHKSKFNPRKADVFSFAIMCSVILTGKLPYHDSPLGLGQKKKQVREGTLRPTLPADCHLRLATLIRKCWAGIPSKRPHFDVICRELRYIKGLLLRDDQEMLNTASFETAGFETPELEGAKIQGPWGGTGRLGKEFIDMATSIKGMKLKYSIGKDGMVGPMEVTYELFGISFVRTYGHGQNGKVETEIVFEKGEFITCISGFTSKLVVKLPWNKRNTITCVVSLTIHTNLQSYGPFGEDKGDPFSSEKGEIVGFHGAAGNCLDRLGVVIISDATS